MAGSSVEFALEASLGQERRVLVAKRIGLFIVMMSIMVALQSLTLKDINILVHGEQMRTVHTAATRVGAVLSRVGIELNEGDVVEPAASTRLESGDTINITRAFPIQIKVDGQLTQVRLTEGTVMEAINSAGIVLGKDDKVLPSKTQQVTPDTAIQVVRVTYAYETVEEAVAFKTERRLDPSLDKGKSRVARAGVEGRLQRTMKVTYEDGKAVKRATTSTEVTQQPVNKVLVVGIRLVPKTVYTSSGKALRYTEMRNMLATAYEPGPVSTGKSSGITATGIKAKKGIVAVDPKVIPLGTRLYIPGYGEALAADTGGSIKGNRIDLCFATVREALQFGRRTVKVYILAKG